MLIRTAPFNKWAYVELLKIFSQTKNTSKYWTTLAMMCHGINWKSCPIQGGTGPFYECFISLNICFNYERVTKVIYLQQWEHIYRQHWTTSAALWVCKNSLSYWWVAISPDKCLFLFWQCRVWVEMENNGCMQR